jgi:hypothetical protein
MVAQSRRAGQGGKRVPAVGLLLAIAVILAVGGSWQLTQLTRAYLLDDIAHDQTPNRLKSWLIALYQHDIEPSARMERIASRLLLMPMPLRRQVVMSMSRPEFWTEATSDFRQRVVMQDEMLGAVNLALTRAPVLGDLWFASAKLSIDNEGMSGAALKRLEYSAIYAPNAGEIALARLLVMQRNWPLLDEASRQIMVRDFAYVTQAYPQQAESIRKEIEALGLRLPAVTGEQDGAQ